MRLSARILDNVANVNNWDHVSEAHISEGEVSSFHFQIINKSKDDIRYLTQAVAYSVTVSFPSIDDAEDFDVIATQPFSDDKSIWKVSLAASQVPSSGAFVVAIVEDGVERKFKVDQSLIVELIENGGC
jgi:hypothetical protein